MSQQCTKALRIHTLHRVTLKEQAREGIRQVIMSGMLKSGEPVSEVSLSEALGISRTPVREAILELSKEGLLHCSPFGGAHVRVLTDTEREEIFILRNTLETLAARRLCRVASVKQIAELEEILQHQAKLADGSHYDRFLDLDQQFHLRIVEFAGLALTHNILRNIRDLFRLMGLLAVAVRGRAQAVVEEHQGIVKAIRTGDETNVTEAVLNHLDTTRKAIEMETAKERLSSKRKNHQRGEKLARPSRK